MRVFVIRRLHLERAPWTETRAGHWTGNHQPPGVKHLEAVLDGLPQRDAAPDPARHRPAAIARDWQRLYRQVYGQEP